MSAVRRNGRRTIFCWCKSACAKAPAAQEKPVRTLSAQKNAGRFAPGSTCIFRALRADAPRKRPHTAQKRSVFLYAVSCCDKCAGKYTVFSVTFAVVPRKGDVDRNLKNCRFNERNGESSPARGTLVKIHALCFVVVRCAVCRMCSLWNSPLSSRILSTSLLPFRRGTDRPNLLCTTARHRRRPSCHTAAPSANPWRCGRPARTARRPRRLWSHHKAVQAPVWGFGVRAWPFSWPCAASPPRVCLKNLQHCPILLKSSAYCVA